MLNQKKVEIFLRKFRKSPAKQFLEIASTKKRAPPPLRRGGPKNTSLK